MKKIEAVISPAKLDEVVRALAAIDINGLTMLEVRTRVAGRVVTARYRGAGAITMDLAPNVKLEVVVADWKASQVVETVRQAARMGSRDDGRILVVPLVEVVRIRTGETGEDAL
jgi:nitrogen regulatory protein PII